MMVDRNMLGSYFASKSNKHRAKYIFLKEINFSFICSAANEKVIYLN